MSNMPHTSDMEVVTHVYPQQGFQGDASPQIEIPPPSNLLRKFLEGEPSVLGVSLRSVLEKRPGVGVQILTGIVILLLGIVSLYVGTVSSYFGITYWGAIIYIITGSVNVRANKELNQCLVKASMGMNIISTIIAGLAIILHIFDFLVPIFPYYSCYDSDQQDSCERNLQMFWSIVWGTTALLLVLSLLEFIVAIYVSAFACDATCSSETRTVIYISSQVPPSIPPSVNTFETPLFPTSPTAPVHPSSSDGWRNGKPEGPPPEYSAIQD